MRKSSVQTKRHLAEAALRVFTQKGFSGASVREIVEHSGVTKPTLYYYYGSKERLYIALLEESFEEFGRRLRKIAAAALPPVRKLTRAVDQYLGHCRRFPDRVKLTLMALYRCDAFAPEVDLAKYLRPSLETLAGIIKEGMAAGIYKPADPFKLCLQLVGIIHTQILILLKPEKNFPKSSPKEIVETFVKGIRRS